MYRYIILKDGDTLWAWDSKDKVMYQKEQECDECVRRPINLQMLSKFSPYCEMIEETDQAPNWIHLI